MSDIKVAAIDGSNSPNSHLLDHIIPLCSLFNASLFSRDVQNERLAKKYYPNVTVIPIVSLERSKEEIAKNYDLLIHPSFWPIELIQDFFETKHIRALYTPHGNSDKHSKKYWMEYFALQDSSLIYGNHMVDYLKEKKVYHQIKHPIFSGNLRYRYYKKHKSWFDNIIKQEVLSHFNPKKKTLLFAPTFDHISSFFQVNLDFIQVLSEQFNLIIKLHPHLSGNNPELVYPFLGKVEKFEHVVTFTEFPLVYPLLEIADLYLGDFSSVGYDFLTYNRPMFFIFNSNIKDQRLTYLHQCGVPLDPEIPSQAIKTIHTYLENDPFYESRKTMYRYTFEEINDNTLKNEVFLKLFNYRR